VGRYRASGTSKDGLHPCGAALVMHAAHDVSRSCRKAATFGSDARDYETLAYAVPLVDRYYRRSRDEQDVAAYRPLAGGAGSI
jgi:hypothetical protein